MLRNYQREMDSNLSVFIRFISYASTEDIVNQAIWETVFSLIVYHV